MEKDITAKYVDEYIKHVINFSIFGNKFCKAFTKEKDRTITVIYDILEKSGALITKKYANTVRQKVNDELDLLSERLFQHIEEALAYIISTENDWLLGPFSNYLGLKLDVKQADANKLLVSPVAYAGIVEDFNKNTVNKYRSLFYDMIAASYITGSVFTDIKESFRDRNVAIDRGVVTEAETLGSALGTQYDRIIFTRNADKFKGFIWSSILDTSTCLVCGELNGKIFEDITKVPMYPAHPRCRCFLIPFVKDISDYLTMSYSEWFSKQSEEDQKTILGEKRYQLYKNGMEIKEFVNNGKVIPLKLLKTK